MPTDLRMAPSKFYDEVDFCNRDLNCKNFCNFLKKLIDGINHNDNKVAQMSSLTIFAFVDKTSIVTETQKYADKIAVLDEKGQKKVMDLMHESLARSEDQTYQFQRYEKNANINTLKALGLAFMQTHNPKVSDKN